MPSSAPRPVIIVPGIDDSGPAHWQTWLETRRPNTTRATQHDWSDPDLHAWGVQIRKAVEASAKPPLIVAHSFGVLAAVHAARRGAQRIGGALLVAPADPALFDCASTLTHLPLPFPTILVASRNDKWLSFGAAKTWSERWRARLVDAGHVGHINVASGHGPWPTVLQLIADLERATEPTLVHTSS